TTHSSPLFPTLSHPSKQQRQRHHGSVQLRRAAAEFQLLIGGDARPGILEADLGSSMGANLGGRSKWHAVVRGVETGSSSSCCAMLKAEEYVRNFLEKARDLVEVRLLVHRSGSRSRLLKFTCFAHRFFFKGWVCSSFIGFELHCGCLR
ncbi:hypothetical protein Droror1_Dr00013735, partial [Drosera rotundifolia]